MTPYISVDDAEDYFDERYGVDAWDDATDADKLKALVQSTRAIDRLNFAGSKTNIYNHLILKQPLQDQELEFPRNSSTLVPDEIKFACCECALAFLDGVSIEDEIQRLITSSKNFSGMNESLNTTFTLEYLKAGIPSVVAWNYLLPFLQDPQQIELSRG